jgi:hypothetical protein
MSIILDQFSKARSLLLSRLSRAATLGVLASATMFAHAQTRIVPRPAASPLLQTKEATYQKKILNAISETAGTRPVIFVDESVISDGIKKTPNDEASVIADQIRHPLLALNLSHGQVEEVVNLFFSSPLILENYQKSLANDAPFAVKLGRDGKLSAQLIFIPSNDHDLLAPTVADKTFFEKISCIAGLDGELARRTGVNTGLVMRAFTLLHETRHAQQDILDKNGERTFINEIADGTHELSSSTDPVRENESKEVDADLAATKQVFQIWHDADILHAVAAARNLGFLAGGEHNSGSDINALTDALSGTPDSNDIGLTRDQMRAARHNAGILDTLYDHKDTFKNDPVLGPLVDGMLSPHQGPYDLDKMIAGYYIAVRLTLLAAPTDTTNADIDGQARTNNKISWLQMDADAYRLLAPEKAQALDKAINKGLVPEPSRSPGSYQSGFEKHFTR